MPSTNSHVSSPRRDPSAAKSALACRCALIILTFPAMPSWILATTSAPGNPDKLGDRLRRDADRLFAIDVLARPQSGDRHFNVEIARRGDDYRLHVRAFE